MKKTLKLVRAAVLASVVVSAAAVPASADGGGGGGGGGGTTPSVKLVTDLFPQNPTLFPKARGKAAYAFDGLRSRFCAEMANTGLPAFTPVDVFEGPAASMTDLGLTGTLPAVSLFPTGTFFCLDSQLGSVVPKMAAGDTVQFRLDDGSGTVVVSGTFHT